MTLYDLKNLLCGVFLCKTQQILYARMMKSTQQQLTVFVHDWIFHIGGAESVFFDLIKKYTQHDTEEKIYTLFSDKEEIEVDGYTYDIITALPRWLNSLFVWWSKRKEWFISRIFDYRNLIVFYPQLCRLLRNKISREYPKHIVISSFAAAKNIISYGAAYRQEHVTLYLHSPNQYIRENHDEYVQKFSRWQTTIFGLLVPYLRRWDSKPRLYDTVLANSQYTAELARKHYLLDDITVQYPKLDPKFDHITPSRSTKNYMVYVGRLTSFVREVDKIITLCNTYHIPLIVMWSGPDEQYLKSLAWPTITWVGRVTDVDEKISIIKNARWLINLAKESCGIATMEALACGIPVFGYGVWGTAELVWPKQWVLVSSKDEESLKRGFEEFLKKFG